MDGWMDGQLTNSHFRSNPLFPPLKHFSLASCFNHANTHPKHPSKIPISLLHLEHPSKTPKTPLKKPQNTPQKTPEDPSKTLKTPFKNPQNDPQTPPKNPLNTPKRPFHSNTPTTCLAEGVIPTCTTMMAL